MLKLCRVDIKRIDQVFKRLEKYKDKLVEEFKPGKIILFGSFARGDISEASDIDLIVVSDWKENFLDRIKLLLDLNFFDIPVEPIGYTEEEFQSLIEAENPFILQVLQEGKTLYESVKAKSHPGEL